MVGSLSVVTRFLMSRHSLAKLVSRHDFWCRDMVWLPLGRDQAWTWGGGGGGGGGGGLVLRQARRAVRVVTGHAR